MSTIANVAPRPSRRAFAALGVVLLVVAPASSVLFAAGGDGPAVERAALSAGLQPAVRLQPPPPPTTPPPTTAPPAHSLSATEKALLDLTNAERVRRGIAPLTHHIDLTAAADIHAADQRNKPCVNGSLSHTGSDGSNTGDRIARTGLQVRDWAENVACGFTTAEAVFDGWMASAGHRRNILNPRLTHIGVSMMRSDGGTPYWVQVFALPR